MMRWTIIAVALLLAGCDLEHERAFDKCISRCTGPDCISACGFAVQRAFSSECVTP